VQKKILPRATYEQINYKLSEGRNEEPYEEGFNQ
jgi:hypothetical protein